MHRRELIKLLTATAAIPRVESVKVFEPRLALIVTVPPKTSERTLDEIFESLSRFRKRKGWQEMPILILTGDINLSVLTHNGVVGR